QPRPDTEARRKGPPLPAALSTEPPDRLTARTQRASLSNRPVRRGLREPRGRRGVGPRQMAMIEAGPSAIRAVESLIRALASPIVAVTCETASEAVAAPARMRSPPAVTAAPVACLARAAASAPRGHEQ